MTENAMLMTIDELAKLLHYSPKTIYKKARAARFRPSVSAAVSGFSAVRRFIIGWPIGRWES